MAPLSFPNDYRVSEIKAFNVSVTSSATQVDSASNLGSFAAFIWVALYNNSNLTLYYGGDSGVTTSNGFPLLPGESVVIPATDAPPFNLYCIAASGSNDLRALLLR